MNKSLLQVDDLAVFRGERCLFSGLSFSINAGQIMQLHGENGSGKTSLIRALCTFLPIENGTISWKGQALPGARDQYLAEICYAGHLEAIKSDLSPRENLTFSAVMMGVGDDSVDECLQRVGLHEQADLPCRVLSAGQRRRVTLARLVLSDAALWLLDEPLTALDVHGRQLVESLIAEHAQRDGAVIFTTHQPMSIASVPIISVELGLSGQSNA